MNTKLQLVTIALTALLGLGLDSKATYSATLEFFNEADFQSSTTNLTKITFDDIPAGLGAFQGNEYISQGLSVTQRDDFAMNINHRGDGSFLNSWPQSFNSGSQGLSSSAIPGGGFNNSITDNFDFEFLSTVTAAGLWIGNTGPGTNAVQFLDASDNVIASNIFSASSPGMVGSCPNCRIFYGITSDVGIAKIRTIEGHNDRDGIVYDDIQFVATKDTTKVPEPVSILGYFLLGTFLLAKKFTKF